MTQILDMSETLMRVAIRAMPDGVYEFEDFVDNDGLSDSPVRLHAKLTIAGDTITVDLTSCADQQRGPINCTPAMSNCAVYYALIAAAGCAVPANAGCYRPITIIHRPGSITDCRAPASVAHRVVVTHRLASSKPHRWRSFSRIRRIHIVAACCGLRPPPTKPRRLRAARPFASARPA